MPHSIARLLVVLCVALTFVTRAEALAGDCMGDKQAAHIVAASEPTSTSNCHEPGSGASAAQEDSNNTPAPHDQDLCQCIAMVKGFTATFDPFRTSHSFAYAWTAPVVASFDSAEQHADLRPPIT